jgi:hypothetical protein
MGKCKDLQEAAAVASKAHSDYVFEKQEKTKKELSDTQNRVALMEGDVLALRNDMASIRKDMASIRKDMASMRKDIASLSKKMNTGTGTPQTRPINKGSTVSGTVSDKPSMPPPLPRVATETGKRPGSQHSSNTADNGDNSRVSKVAKTLNHFTPASALPGAVKPSAAAPASALLGAPRSSTDAPALTSRGHGEMTLPNIPKTNTTAV